MTLNEALDILTSWDATRRDLESAAIEVRGIFQRERIAGAAWALRNEAQWLRIKAKARTDGGIVEALNWIDETDARWLEGRADEIESGKLVVPTE